MKTTTRPSAESIAQALRNLACVIRKHGTCAPAALEQLARDLDAGRPDVHSLDFKAGFKAGMKFQEEQFSPQAAEVGEEMVEAVCSRFFIDWDSCNESTKNSYLEGMRTALTAAIAARKSNG
jgi:hypothetical protein